MPAAELPDIATDLVYVCLVERSLIERAANAKSVREPDRVMSAFKWYGSVSNIQPTVFNVGVDVFEAIEPLDVAPSSDAYAAFQSSYQFEEENGHSHRVTGDIVCHAASVDEILRKVFRQ